MRIVKPLLNTRDRFPRRTTLVLTLAFCIPISVRAQQGAAAPGRESAVQLAQFRQMIAAARAAAAVQPRKGEPHMPPLDFGPADEAFQRVLTLQARADAARQSQDRLAGWNKAIKPRVENQSIAAIEVEILAFAEKKAGVEVARLEGEMRHAIARANEIAGRPRESSLIVRVDLAALSSAEAEALAAAEKEVLERGRDLLDRMFQSFTVGGLDVTELLWYQTQASEAERNYRLWAAEAGFAAAVNMAGKSR